MNARLLCSIFLGATSIAGCGGSAGTDMASPADMAVSEPARDASGASASIIGGYFRQKDADLVGEELTLEGTASAGTLSVLSVARLGASKPGCTVNLDATGTFTYQASGAATGALVASLGDGTEEIKNCDNAADNVASARLNAEQKKAYNDLYSGAVSDLNDTGFALMNKANVKYVYDRK